MKSRFRKLVGAALFACASLSPQLRADDIDLYTGGEAATGVAPNILIVLDNSTNWAAANQGWPVGKQGESELEALSEIVSTLGDNVNVGMLMAAGSNGGYVRFAVREMNTTNKAAFTSMLNTMVANFGGDGDNDDKVNTSSIVYDNMMNAAYRYFNGFARFGTTDLPSGSSLDLRDYAGSTVNTTKMPAGALAGNSLSAANAAAYTAPSGANGGCSKNFVIFIGNGYPNQAGVATDISTAAALAGVTLPDVLNASGQPGADGIPDAIQNVIGGDNAKIADEWARFMYTYGVKSTVDDPRSTTTPKAKLINKITTYTIDVCKDACEADQATLLKSMAKVGGGKYFKSTSKSEIKNAMALIFAEIQAVNSVFASATLPISVNTQGTYENQVYIGVFRPDGGARPRWMGNLKEYKFGRYCDADRNDKVHIDTTRVLVNGMIPATLTGNATGPVTGTFTGTLTNVAGATVAVSGTVTGTVSGSATATLAATLATSAGTTLSPAADAGSGAVTGSISGTGTGSGSSTFTGTFSATPSVSGTFTSSDERVGDDVPAPDCGSDGSGKIPLKLYLGDKNGYRAIDEEGNTGFIDLSAKSYWTSASTFWTATPNAVAGASDLPDGPEVERGAAAHRLRTVWAQAATSPNEDGRNVYTCLGTCLAAGATTAQKTLSNNVIHTTNSEVTTALAAPSGAKAVTLSRSGSTVTATVTSGTHTFSDGDSVVIAGVTGAGTDGSGTVTDYNGTKTVTTGGSNTTFTYTITETPALSRTGTAQFGAGSTTRTITSIVLSGTGCTAGACKAGNTVTATMVAGGSVASPANIAGTVGAMSVAGSAATNFLDKNGAALTLVSGSTYTYSLALPAAPGAATGATATSGGLSQAGMTVSFDATNNRFTLTCGTCSGSNKQALAALASGASVVVSNASDPLYNGTWTLASNATNTALVMTYRTYSGCASGCGAGTATSGGTPATETITITRSAGATSASVTTAGAGFNTSPNVLSNGSSVSVTATGYTATYTVSGVAHSGSLGTGTTTFTISPITTGPAAAAGAVTATLSGAGSGPPTSSLILWTRGKDLWEDEDLNGSLTNVRASIHGDVLHARPAVVNYGSSIGVVGFYGANDGFLRAISGGVSSTDGRELWAFMPTEFMNYTKLARLYTNSELVRYPNSSCSITPAPTARNYFWDGPITVYQSADGTASTPPTKTWLFAAMRRGGRAVYAIDVTTPTAPKFMWRITNGTSGFSELAQTWSEPKITKLKGSFTRADSTVITNPVVLVFGAGYDDAQEDKQSGSPVAPTKGRGVFVVEAETGQLIQFLQPTSGVAGYSFAADVNVLDLNADGFADRIYAADTNANIFRFDTVQTVTDVASSSYWKRYHIAQVGDVGGDGGADARKFMFQPEVLPFSQSGVIKTMVLVGSGNREKPLNNFLANGTTVNALTCPALYSNTYFSTSSSNKVEDRFFGLLDAVQSGDVEATVNANPIVIGQIHQVNSSTLSNNALTPFSLSGSDRGWSILLRNDPDGNGVRDEEKAVNSARVVGGVAFFATNTPAPANPSAGMCSNLGEALGYAVEPFTGMPAINRDNSSSSGTATYTAADYATKFGGGGLPPTVTAGVVSIGGTPYRFVIGGGGEALTSASSIAGARSVLNLTGTRSRLFWSYGAD